MYAGLIPYNHCKLIKLTFFVPFTKNGIFNLTKCGPSHKAFCILRSVSRIELLKRIIAVVTGACIFGAAATFINKDCRVLFGDIFIVPFLGPALGYLTAICSPGWLVAFDWTDLPVGREFDGKFLKNVKSPPHALPPPSPPLA